MKPSELYEMQPQEIDVGVSYLFGCYFNHIEEIGDCISELQYGTDHSIFDDIEVKIIKKFNFDGRRYWMLAAVWFDGNPIMVIQNAGREGDDHHARFITDPENYKKMLSYIKSMIPWKDVEIPHCDPDQDIVGLDSFYGNSLNGYFERY